MSTIKVQNIQHTGSSTNAIALASDGTCTANLTNRTNKRLTINGAMTIAQRGSSSTIDGYGSIDRFRSNLGGCDENPTQGQVDVASGTTPYTLGFRKAFKMTNGNQTSGAGTADGVAILHRIEAQDIANSGWNYTDSNSKITLSFWCKSSVAQNFYGFFRTQDGTPQLNAFETGSLTADTWTKVTKTITGDSNLQFDNNNDTGLDIEFVLFRGTDTTGTLTLNQWAAYNSSTRVPDMASTWYTTNDATFEITGVQLEVSDHATDFEHKCYQDEYLRCSRYFYHANSQHFFCARGNNTDTIIAFLETQVPLRANPSVTLTGNLRHWGIDSNSSSSTQPTIPSFRANQKGIRINQTGHSGVNDDCVMTVQVDGNDGQGLFFDAEL